MHDYFAGAARPKVKAAACIGPRRQRLQESENGHGGLKQVWQPLEAARIKTMQRIVFQGVMLPVLLSIALLVGCERGDQAANSAQNRAHADQPAGDERPLGQVTEFDDFTLRASVSPTETLPEEMARQYGIEAGPDLVLLNLVVLETRTDRQPAPVSAVVSARYEDLIGRVEVIDMRAVEAHGLVSYIGTLRLSDQRVYRFTIEAQPSGADEPLRMSFEVLLDKPSSD